MSKTTFACTLLKTDHGTFRAGDVIRSSFGGEFPWCQCIILGFSDPKQHNGDVYVKVARPYAYATCVGTSVPGVLTGVEHFELPASKLAFETVLTSGDNHPMLAGGTRPHYDSDVIDLRTEKKVA